MQNSLRTALQKLSPGMKTVRKQAQRTWSLLQEPVALGQNHWLLFRPTAVALSETTGMGNNIDAQLAISLQPALVSGDKPIEKPAPLPALQRYYPGSSGLNLQLDLELDFAMLNQKLSSTLARKTLNVHGQETGITAFVLSGSGDNIRVQAELAGAIAGTIDLHARLLYNTDERKLELHNLMFDYEGKDPAVSLLVKSFHDDIRQALEVAFNQALAQHLEQLGHRLKTALQRAMPASLLLDMSALQIDNLNLHIAQQGIRLEGAASGSAQLLLR